MNKEPIVCLECYGTFQDKFKSTFLGFKKYLCPHCGAKIVYDLRPSYRVLYWLLSILGVGAMIVIIAQGDVPVPGLIGVATIWALIDDHRKRDYIETARNHIASTKR